MVTFGVPNNKVLDKFASKQTQKRFEELVTKVEKHSRLAENQNSTVKIFWGFVCMILVLLLGIACASFLADHEPSAAEQTQKLCLELANKLMDNSAQTTVDTFLSSKRNTFVNLSALTVPIKSKTNSAAEDEDEQWIILLGNAVNSLDRKVMLPKLFFFLTCILGIAVMIFTAKSKLDTRKSYQRVCDLLNKENQDYFCKQGYIWSIDHKLSQLVVTRSHDLRTSLDIQVKHLELTVEWCGSAIE